MEERHVLVDEPREVYRSDLVFESIERFRRILSVESGESDFGQPREQCMTLYSDDFSPRKGGMEVG